MSSQLHCLRAAARAAWAPARGAVGETHLPSPAHTHTFPWVKRNNGAGRTGQACAELQTLDKWVGRQRVTICRRAISFANGFSEGSKNIEGGKTKSGARKRFLVNPCGRVGNTIAPLSGKKRLGILLFSPSPTTSGRAKHPTRKSCDTNCLLKTHSFNICTAGRLSRCIDTGILGFTWDLPYLTSLRDSHPLVRKLRLVPQNETRCLGCADLPLQTHQRWHCPMQ